MPNVSTIWNSNFLFLKHSPTLFLLPFAFKASKIKQNNIFEIGSSVAK